MYYANMADLTDAIATSDEKSKQHGICKHAKKFKPLRDAIAHTGLLTEEAKKDLELNFTNIKERIIKKLDDFKNDDTLLSKDED